MVTAQSTARVFAGLGLSAAGVLHLSWAAGSSWPGTDADDLARLVAGAAPMPPAPATAVVGFGMVATGAVLIGVGGQRWPARTVRLAAAMGLLARGIAGGDAALKLLAMPEADPRFSRLDRRYYRPLCLGLGLAALVGSASRPTP